MTATLQKRLLLLSYPLLLESRCFVKKRFILLIVLEVPCMMLSVSVW